MNTNPDDMAIQCLGQYERRWYVTAPDYDEVIEGPFNSAAEAFAALNTLITNYEPPDPPGWEGGFAENH